MGAPGQKKKALLPAAKAFDLEKLVEYGEGAVVSRTLVQNDAGTITLFAFDKGEALSEHTAPFDAVVHLLDGEGEIVIGGRRHRVCRGEFIVMPAGVPHAVKAMKRFKMLLTMLRAGKR
ncbi:MAG: cupin [Planctomycetes bacterium RBG_16_59_8]|nr:MAG: cupin [Planctomycetes bacterium RBG_16_59_8]